MFDISASLNDIFIDCSMHIYFWNDSTANETRTELVLHFCIKPATFIFIIVVACFATAQNVAQTEKDKELRKMMKKMLDTLSVRLIFNEQT